MRTITITILGILVATASPALAWDGGKLWYESATADSPGGGGILGTGGAHDYGVKCSHCHVERKMTTLAFGLEFSPALPMVAGVQSYAPGQRYTITAKMTNETLGITCADPYGMNVNNFAAAFEDESGVSVGMLETDTGDSAAACPLEPKMPDDPGTTGIAVDCKVVFAKGTENIKQWTFYWTAPDAGAVNIFWGAVDGDCMMSSMEDAVVEGKVMLGAPAMASRAPAQTPWSPALASVLLGGVLLIPFRRRRPNAQT